MRWTEEAIEDLKRLASEGRSASVIATELGAASRNAVIGKASRMGIRLNGDGRASTPGRTRGAARPAPLAGAARLRAGDRIHGGAFALAMWARRKDGGRSASAFGEAEVGEMLRVRFDEIRQSACRWPLGDPRSGEFAFCGLMPLNGRSYCPGHCRMAYRPPNAAAGPRERQGLRALSRCWLF
jgi:GcrA cell cycle regulator